MNKILLDESLEYLIDYRGKTPKKTESGIPLITAKIIKNGELKDFQEYISEEDFDDWMIRGIPQENDVCLTVEAPLGEIAQIPSTKVALAQRVITMRGKEGVLDNNYFKYYCMSKRFQNDLDSRATGTTVLGIKQSELRQISLSLIEYEDQIIVGEFLKNLDKKIRLNKKMNETLEEIAKTLFKSWFIDFDPVRAKAEGKPTGLSKEISDLFPNSFEGSELGEIPKSWNLLTFGDFVTPTRGKVITKKTTNPGDIPVVAGGLEPAYFHSIANVQGPAVTISASGANAGYTNLYFEDIWASDCSYISSKQSSNVFTSYIFLKLNQDRIFDSQHGAAQPHIYPDDLTRLDMVIPSNDLYATFENLITSFFNKIKLNIDETKNLISLRDTLLPKLISGELKISDAESLVEEAGI